MLNVSLLVCCHSSRELPCLGRLGQSAHPLAGSKWQGKPPAAQNCLWLNSFLLLLSHTVKTSCAVSSSASQWSVRVTPVQFVQWMPSTQRLQGSWWPHQHLTPQSDCGSAVKTKKVQDQQKCHIGCYSNNNNRWSCCAVVQECGKLNTKIVIWNSNCLFE